MGEGAIGRYIVNIINIIVNIITLAVITCISSII